MTNAKEFIQEELKSLMHRGFVATPESADELMSLKHLQELMEAAWTSS